MATTCSDCGAKLGFGRRLAREALCADCEQRHEEARKSAVEDLRTAMREMMTMEDPADVVSRLPAMAGRGNLSAADVAQVAESAAREMIETVLADEYLTEEEEGRLNAAVNALGIPQQRAAAVLGDLANRYVIARVNAGRLPEVQSSQIMLKRGEIAHIEVAAVLMKEVVHRETRGGYSGFSFPITKGIRYRVGAFHGKSVVVGTSVEASDSGTLSVTSKRAVYKGLRKSIELPYSKLIGVNVFDDGIQFHASNRQNAPLFRVADGHLVAAVANAAWQRLEKT